MRYIAASLIGFGWTCLLVWLLLPFAARLGLIDHPGPRKIHRDKAALVGGIAMFAAFTFCLFIFDISFSGFGSFVAAATLLVVVGLIDDLRHLPWYLRFATQITAALIMTLAGGVVVEDLGAIVGHGSLKLGIWAVPFTVFATVGVINALNMLDGLDGLAGGICLIAFALLAFIAMAGGHYVDGFVLILLACVVGGFLLFNLRLPWRGRPLAFMGDAGSTFLGFTLTWFVISLSQGEGRAMTPVTALWILALPIIDTVSLLIRRMLSGRSPFAADHAHLHHLLLLAGYSANKTNIILWSAALIVGSVGVVAFYQGIPQPVLFCGFVGLSLFYLWRVMRIEKISISTAETVPVRPEN